jgi:hypothetical protein
MSDAAVESVATLYEERDAVLEARARLAALLAVGAARHRLAAGVLCGVLLDDAPDCSRCAAELVLSAILLVSHRTHRHAVEPRLLTLGRSPFTGTTEGMRCRLHIAEETR